MRNQNAHMKAAAHFTYTCIRCSYSYTAQLSDIDSVWRWAAAHHMRPNAAAAAHAMTIPATFVVESATGA